MRRPERKKARSEEAERRYRRLRVLYRISDLINSTTEEKRLLRRVLKEAVRELGATSGSLALLEGDPPNSLRIVVAQGANSQNVRDVRLEIGQGVVGKVVETGAPVRVDDVSRTPFYVSLRPDVRSELAVPLVIGGRISGVLNVDSDRLGAFSAEDEQLLMAIAHQAAKVIHTSRLYEQLTLQAARLEALLSAGQALIAPEPLGKVLQRLTETVQRMLDIRLCSVMLLNDKRELEICAVAGGGQHYTQRASLSVSDSLIGQVVIRRAPLQVFDVRKAQGYRSRSMARKERLASLLSVPILYQQKPIGLINIYTSKPRLFTAEEIRLLDAFASLCAIAIENARRYESVLRAEENIRKADRLATLGVLSAEIAHEIRNPVSIISMLVSSLLEDGAVASERRKDLEIIAQKLERISRIVAQVLNFSKQQAPRYEWIDIGEVLSDLFLLMEHALATKHILAKYRAQRSLPRVFLDRGHLEQVLMNLILNAVQAMPHGGLLTVRARLVSRPAPHVEIAVSDTGKGIPREILENIFDPFVTSRKEGVGLGLFVSQKLLAQYGGRLEVSKTGARGTTLKILLPLEASGGQHA